MLSQKAVHCTRSPARQDSTHYRGGTKIPNLAQDLPVPPKELCLPTLPMPFRSALMQTVVTISSPDRTLPNLSPTSPIAASGKHMSPTYDEKNIKFLQKPDIKNIKK